MIQTPRFETGDTRQFTVVYSAAPTTTPLLTITTRSSGLPSALVFSAAGVSSSAFAYFAFVTFPGSLGTYDYTWVASFAGVGPVIERGLFQVVHTRA
jgi:hypothetical protein